MSRIPIRALITARAEYFLSILLLVLWELFMLVSYGINWYKIVLQQQYIYNVISPSTSS